jgi:hypothetical protein
VIRGRAPHRAPERLLDGSQQALRHRPAIGYAAAMAGCAASHAARAVGVVGS